MIRKKNQIGFTSKLINAKVGGNKSDKDLNEIKKYLEFLRIRRECHYSL